MAVSPRPDPALFELGDRPASEFVIVALRQIEKAIDAGISSQMVVMSAARMAGDGVLGMALGEYIIHAWDLATATGRTYTLSDATVDPAHDFLRTMVAPEYRGPDSGFFDAEVDVNANAPALDRLLGFAGRDPSWMP